MTNKGTRPPTGGKSARLQLDHLRIDARNFDERDSQNVAFELDLYVALAAKLWAANSSDFYVVTRQVQPMIHGMIKSAHQVKDDRLRKQIVRRLRRAQGAIEILTENPLYIEGSGVVGASRPRSDIHTVTSGGLPGLGKSH